MTLDVIEHNPARGIPTIIKLQPQDVKLLADALDGVEYDTVQEFAQTAWRLAVDTALMRRIENPLHIAALLIAGLSTHISRPLNP